MSSTIEIKKICEQCGKEFIARKSSTRYCSKRCAEHAYKDKRREEHVRLQNELSGIKREEIKNPILDFMTPRQCATFLGIGKSTVYRALASNSMYLYDIIGTKLIFEGRYDEAVDWLKRVTPRFEQSRHVSKYFDRDPFGYKGRSKNAPLYKLHFAEKMTDLEKQIKKEKDPNQKADLMLTYANGMQNPVGARAWPLTTTGVKHTIGHSIVNTASLVSLPLLLGQKRYAIKFSLFIPTMKERRKHTHYLASTEPLLPVIQTPKPQPVSAAFVIIFTTTLIIP